MSIIPRTVLLGSFWGCFSRDKNEAAQEFDSVIGDYGSPIGSSRHFSCPVGETADPVKFIHGKRADR